MKSDLARQTIERGYSVRQLEALAAQQKAEEGAKAPAPRRKARQMPVELTELEGRIRETMGIRATLTGSARKGRIVLTYYSAEELEHLNELLQRLEDR